MSLLAQRGSGRRRSKSPWLQYAATAFRRLVGGRRTELVQKKSVASAASMVAMAGVFACIGVGYLLGNVFPWRTQPQSEQLSAGGPQTPQRGVAPGPIDDKEALAQRAANYFLTAVYPQQTDAMLAMRSLRRAGLPMAGLQLLSAQDKATGKDVSYYGLVVWFDGERDKAQALSLLRQVPPPDSEFERFRKTDKGWPREMAAR